MAARYPFTSGSAVPSDTEIQTSFPPFCLCTPLLRHCPLCRPSREAISSGRTALSRYVHPRERYQSELEYKTIQRRRGHFIISPLSCKVRVLGNPGGHIPTFKAQLSQNKHIINKRYLDPHLLKSKGDGSQPRIPFWWSQPGYEHAPASK